METLVGAFPFAPVQSISLFLFSASIVVCVVCQRPTKGETLNRQHVYTNYYISRASWSNKEAPKPVL